MSARAMIWAGEVDGLTSTTKLVLIALANRASDRGTSCFPSVPTIAAWCRLSDRAVQKAIKTLEEEGYIRVERRPNNTHNFTLLMNLKIVAERYRAAVEPVNEVNHVANVERKGGERRADEPVNEPITQPKKRTPVIPGGSQSLPDMEPPPNLLGEAKPAPAKTNDTAQMIDAWNHIVGSKGIPKVAMLTDARKTTLLARYEEAGGTFDDWLKFCRRIARSPFLTGDNDRDWMPNFDWCLKPANFVKIIEGTYDPKGYQSGNREARFPVSPGTI